jgi:hypothetical protein
MTEISRSAERNGSKTDTLISAERGISAKTWTVVAVTGYLPALCRFGGVFDASRMR